MNTKLLLFLLFVLFLFPACAKKNTAPAETELATEKQTQTKKVLVFTKTLGWRHKSIETGVATIKDFGKTHNFVVEHTEDSTHFSTAFLPQYDAIVFLSTTGNVLDDDAQKKFEKYIQGGGSYLGIHAAADTEYDWPWYGKLVGGYFESHPNDPNIRKATIIKTTNKHRSTSHFETSFSRDDEWYNYKEINPEITALLNLDETSYEGGTNGKKHPIAWYHLYDGGKAFYTGGGHTKESYNEVGFRKHLEEAMLWCLE
ncbi:ThuA domain-containing protein [Dokdonia ponticola]|uniref:ThuA domain-containing protein n=1 Tax=Dokdonia ponticola TaxID=2041041 RepID=A0ABV9HUT9_9FLAO